MFSVIKRVLRALNKYHCFQSKVNTLLLIAGLKL